MPTYILKSPSGQPVEVEAEEGASQADLIRLAQAKVQQTTQQPAGFGEKVQASVLGRIGKGLKDPIDAGAQLLPRGLSALTSVGGLFPNRASEWLDKEAKSVDAGIEDSERQYQTARWKDGQQGFDGARLTGNIVNPATLALARLSPQGAASTLGRAAQGAVGGFLGGVAATPVTDQSDTSFGMQKVGQGAMGLAGGAVATPVLGKAMDMLAPPVKAMTARFLDPAVVQRQASMQVEDALDKVVRDLGMERANVPNEVMGELRKQVAASIKKGYKLDASAALRKMDFDAENLPALRGQITRDPGEYSRAMNLRGVEGVGEPIQNTLQAQNQGITTALTKFGGPKAQEAVPAGSMFTGALSKLDERMRGEVTRAYQNARASSGKDWDVPLGGLSSDVGSIVDDFGVGAEKNAIPSAVYSRLQKLGIVGDGMTQRKVFNYEEADKLLKQINSHMSGGSNGSLGALHGAVKKAILEGGGDGDPFAPARKLAAGRFSMIDALPALENVIKGNLAPDDFVQRYIVNGKVGELKKLREVLPDDALAETKKQIARVIYEGAFRNNATGDKMASPAGLQSAMKSIGTEKLKLFFSQQEIDQLNRLTRITAYANTEPAWGTVARGGNPGGVLFGGVAKLAGAGRAMGSALPLLGAGQKALEASSAMNTTIPRMPNLTPQEIAKLSGLLGVTGVSAGGLLAPGP